MKIRRYADTQIIAILRQAESGVPVAELCREHGSRYIETIDAAQDQATEWIWTYNHDHPKFGIGGITPAMKLKWLRKFYACTQLEMWKLTQHRKAHPHVYTIPHLYLQRLRLWRVVFRGRRSVCLGK